ncbi:MAG: SPFH/Band 7/PHB domain protein [Spirochaetes bacterium]|nr:SPFH/Band 7/PHB domain protein [Spirochaetota bacterium]
MTDFSVYYIIIGLIALFVFILIIKGIRIVPQAQTMVIERLGKFHKILKSGVNIIIPALDKPRNKNWSVIMRLPDGSMSIAMDKTPTIDLRENVFDFSKQNVITKDNVIIEIDAMLYYQLTDPVKSLYEIANLPNAIEKLTKTTLRNVIGEMDLDETLSSRDKINHRLRQILDDATDKWGVKINRVEIQDINPPKDIKDAMEKQMRAERDRRAAILQAEGDKQSKILESEGTKRSAINRADGDKQARILKAEGEAEAKIKIAEAESFAIEKITAAISKTRTDPGTYLIALKYMDTLESISSGKDNKVIYLPYEATAILGSIGSIKELFGKKNEKKG